jgi:hypothetical protein
MITFLGRREFINLLGGTAAALRVCPGTSSGITKFSEHEAD